MRRITAATILVGVFLAVPALAALDSAARDSLDSIYEKRPDLQRVFKSDWSVVPGSFIEGKLADLEDWARKYGWREHKEELVAFSPDAVAEEPKEKVIEQLEEREASRTPVALTSKDFPASLVTAKAWMVIDEGTRKVLSSRNEDANRSMASITKLMTAMVSLEKGLYMNKPFSLARADYVGGASLRVPYGTKYSVRDLFDAMLVGSANNAANAVSRASGLREQEFIDAMNERAERLGLKETKFVDPTGIEPENVSTAREIAALGFEALEIRDIKRATTTSKARLTTGPQLKTIKNTNGLLTDPYNGLYVLGGKTGYLEESMWNLVVKMKDTKGNPPLMVVVLGSGSKYQSFKDAKRLAEWSWNNHAWE